MSSPFCYHVLNLPGRLPRKIPDLVAEEETIVPRTNSSRGAHYPGPVNRRAFLQVGLAGVGSLSLPELFRLRASAAPTKRRERNALIVVWLQGGASHLETYDPKPNASSEIRGPYQAIATRVPGIRISELLPRHAKLADKFAILRSMVHTGFCHQQGNQQMFTGHPELVLKLKLDHPDLFSITHSLRGDPGKGLPGYVGVNPIPYLGAAYLGPAQEPFAVYGDPNSPDFSVPNIGANPAETGRLNGRMDLRRKLDPLRRAADQQDFDGFHVQAHSLLTGAEAARAFDIRREDPK